MSTVTVGKAELELELPSSFCVRYEVAAAAVRSKHRAYAAALGLSSRQVQAWVGPYECDPLVYGGHVIDYFAAQGVPVKAVVQAGQQAWTAITKTLPSRAEVKEAEDFSKAPAGGSTG